MSIPVETVPILNSPSCLASLYKENSASPDIECPPKPIPPETLAFPTFLSPSL